MVNDAGPLPEDLVEKTTDYYKVICLGKKREKKYASFFSFPELHQRALLLLYLPELDQFQSLRGSHRPSWRRFGQPKQSDGISVSEKLYIYK